MQFFEWRLTGVVRQPWENHIFSTWEKGRGPKGDPRTDCFIALCEHPIRGRGGHSGENNNHPYCARCKELAPIFEAEAQEQEKARVVELELRRPEIMAALNEALSKMTIDELLRVPGILKRYFNK